MKWSSLQKQSKLIYAKKFNEIQPIDSIHKTSWANLLSPIK
jgi:hypothetical protein